MSDNENTPRSNAIDASLNGASESQRIGVWRMNYRQIERELANLKAENTRITAEIAESDDFMAFMSDALSQFPCCHDEGEHKGTSPMMWPELIGCIIKRAVKDQTVALEADKVRLIAALVAILAYNTPLPAGLLEQAREAIQQARKENQ